MPRRSPGALLVMKGRAAPNELFVLIGTGPRSGPERATARRAEGA